MAKQFTPDDLAAVEMHCAFLEAKGRRAEADAIRRNLDRSTQFPCLSRDKKIFNEVMFGSSNGFQAS